MLLHDVADQQETSFRVLGFEEEMVFKKEMRNNLMGLGRSSHCKCSLSCVPIFDNYKQITKYYLVDCFR